jgi:hypothetical protein
MKALGARRCPGPSQSADPQADQPTAEREVDESCSAHHRACHLALGSIGPDTS